MSAAGRRALWDRERAELPRRDPGRLGPPRGRDRLPGRYDVVKVNTDGRRIPVKSGLAWGVADALAGRLRDRMSDEAVDEGWDFQAVVANPRRAEVTVAKGKPTKSAADIAAWRQRTREREAQKIAAERVRLEKLGRSLGTDTGDVRHPPKITPEGNGRGPSKLS